MLTIGIVHRRPFSELSKTLLCIVVNLAVCEHGRMTQNPDTVTNARRGGPERALSRGADAGSETAIYVLGTLRVTIAGRRVDQQLPGRNGRRLLAYMALNRARPCRRSELIGVLWQDRQPVSPDNALSTTLSRLRHVVGADVVQGRSELSLRLPADAWVDVEAAGERAATARRALEDGDRTSALRAASAAIDLLSGVLLPEFDDDWIEERRREFEGLRVDALEIAAQAALTLGPAQVDAARRAARRLVELEPWRESGYALLMRAHAEAGDIAEGLRVFERLRVLLRDELGASPSALVLELHQLLLTGQTLAMRAPPITSATSRPPAADSSREDARPEVRLPLRLGTLARCHFVGRSEEIGVLEERWRDVVGGGDAVVLVCGDAGMGKTALAAQLAQRAHADGGIVLLGSCDQHALRPYEPIAEALRPLWRQCAGAWMARQTPDELSDLGRIIPELRDRVRDDRPPADAPDQRFRLFEAVSGLLTLAAQQHPLLLVLDDAHWGDRSTFLLLRHIIRELDRSRLMVLVAYRNPEVVVDHPLHETLTDLARIRPTQRLALGGLAPNESADLIRAKTGAAPSAERLRRWQERTDGHPFFLHEILRHASAAGEASPESDLPASIADLIAGRVGRLAPGGAAALGAASVIGRQFELDVVTALTGGATEKTIAALEDAMEHGLIDEVPGVFDRFEFTHALVRETLYAQHSRSRRARLHLRIGTLLEHGMGNASPADLAHHFFHAGPLAGYEQAVRHSALAAAAALDAFAWEEAATHYARALSALDAAGPDAEHERCELLLALGEAQWRAGDADVEATFARAADSARGRGDAEQLARAALGGRYHESGIPDPGRVALLEEALTALGGGEHAVVHVQVLALLAEALHFVNHDRRALALSAQALGVTRELGDPEARIAALLGRHAVLLDIEHVEERLSVLQELILLAGQAGRPDLQAHGHAWSTYALLEIGDHAGARARHDIVARLAAQLRAPEYDRIALAWSAMFAQLDGAVDRAEDLANEGRELAERAHGLDPEALYAAQLLFIRRSQGRIAEIVPLLETFVATQEIPTWRAAFTLALAETGDTKRAQRSLEIAAAHTFGDVPRGMWWLVSLALLSEACATLRNARAAACLYSLLTPYADRSVQAVYVTHLGSVQRHLGLLAATMSDWTLAETHFEAAARRHAWSPVLTALTRRDHARILAVQSQDAMRPAPHR